MQKNVLLIPLKAIGDSDKDRLGAKAFYLARMARIRLRVPPGFCLTSEAYKRHLQSHSLLPNLDSNLDRLKDATDQTKLKILSDIRQAIVAAPLADQLADQIENDYRSLGTECVAVRSSATAEDLPGHSFAGLHDTYLGVTGLDNCIDAIKKCWASLWTDRAYEYRQKNGLDHLTIGMAVIVQLQIAAEASGVIFTADPVTGRSGQVIIEGSFGLGDLLVSGKVNPDRFVINKQNLKIVSKTISEKKIKSVLDEQGSVREQAVVAEQRSVACVDDHIVRELTACAKRLETKFGCPQDVEWALRGKEIFLLQSRPITTLPAEKTWQDRQVWTLFEQISGLISVKLGDNSFYGLIAGRLYFNINTGIGLFKNFLPRLQHYDYDLNKAFGGEQGKMYDLGRFDIQDADVPDLQFSRLKTILKSPISLYRILSHNLKKGERFVADMSSKNERLQRMDVVAMSEQELLAHSAALTTDGIQFADGILYIATGLITFPLLHKVCSKWLADNDGTIANKLLAGVGDMDSAEAGHDLWRLAKKAHECPDVRTLIVAGKRWKTVRQKLCQTKAGNEFLKSWDEFITRHGHHCRGEMELSNPRWSQTPDYILSVLREYIGGIDEAEPLQNRAKRAQQRGQLSEHCRQRLKNPLKRFIFNYLLTRAQRGCVLRENWKSQGVRYIARFRKTLIELGDRLYARGVIAAPDDIFFLELEEIEPVTQGTARFDVRETISTRRAEYEKDKSMTPPPVVIGKFDPHSFIPEAVNTDVEVLNGLAVSPGVVTGKARVIVISDTDQHVLAGEILVAPFTDPGWTPYFVPAAAIVMDQGGLLSHGSIIAREYGIPAVVNVGSATKIIKTGQTIAVDGNRGLVRILG
ncbi:MAG: PEP/pyruvate-binding domain-containing protein [Planctomycetota bacterium]|jgi:pyruvate,water dikinase